MGLVAAAIGLAFAAGASAQTMSKSEYDGAKKNIESDYKGAKAGCDPMRANVRDICLADVAGREIVALAQLQAAYRPSEKARYEVRIAKAQAAYSLAREKCDDEAGDAKDVCLKEAEAASTAARADAVNPAKKL